MISRELLQHELWKMSIGYLLDRREMKSVLRSHLEAWNEIDRLKAELDRNWI